MPVNPGHIGPAPKPPSHVDVPLAGPYDGPMVNGALSPYLQPPPSTTGQNSGMFPGHGGLTPPVNWTNINPNGGMYGCAPIQRWGGQVTRDMGYLRSFGSKLTDFGVDVDQLTPVKRATSEEGPRPATYPGVQGSPTNRQTNLAGAQGTTDLHGNRSMFHKSGSLPRMTIAPY
jgi:hypothetical protein